MKNLFLLKLYNTECRQRFLEAYAIIPLFNVTKRDVTYVTYFYVVQSMH